MTDEPWRPLGVDTEEEIAEYDALHDGVPAWMREPFWAWVREALTTSKTLSSGWSGASVRRIATLNVSLAEELCQRLRLPMHDLRGDVYDYSSGQSLLVGAVLALRNQKGKALQIADYLLAFGSNTKPGVLGDLLDRSKSAWTVGTRAGKPALVRRVPEGVQVGGDTVMARSGRAGARLAKAWEDLYSPTPEPSDAWSKAIKAAEDAAVPVVLPKATRGTLGDVIRTMEAQKTWRLPMEREHPDAPSGDVVLGVLRVLWHGYYDRHGGQPLAPGDVTFEEARVAVMLATTVVDWFSAGLVERRP